MYSAKYWSLVDEPKRESGVYEAGVESNGHRLQLAFGGQCSLTAAAGQPGRTSAGRWTFTSLSPSRDGPTIFENEIAHL